MSKNALEALLKAIKIKGQKKAKGKAHLNLIDKAHQNGYEVTLLYVAVNSVKTARLNLQDD